MIVILGGSNNPNRTAHIKIHKGFGHEHQIFIRYLHESGICDQEILERVWDTFADKFDVAPGISEERRKQDLAGKVAVYTSRWADVEAPESEIATFTWGAALIEEMAGRRNGGNEIEEIEKLIDI